MTLHPPALSCCSNTFSSPNATGHSLHCKAPSGDSQCHSHVIPSVVSMSLKAVAHCFNVHASVTTLQEAAPQEAGVQGPPSELPTASPTSPTQGLVMSGPAPGRSMGASSSRASGRLAGAQTAVEAAPGGFTPDIAQPSSARDQVRCRFS